MKRKALTLTFVLALLISVIAGMHVVNLAAANFFGTLPTLTIKNDGTIEPATDCIKQTGSTYTLTRSICREYAITIQCSNIVLDGAGQLLDCTIAKNVPYLNGGLSLEGVTNVTVKDLLVAPGIALSNCSECTISNVAGLGTGIGISNGSSNLITECTLEDLSLGENNEVTKSNITYLALGKNNTVTENNVTQIFVYHSVGNTVRHNNFYRAFASEYSFEPFSFEELATLEQNTWESNYWGDYSTRYPNASEIGDSGIGDTPYVINTDNVDYYPLMGTYVPDVTNPVVNLVSPENKTYTDRSIELNFTVNEPVSWVGYSLDGQDNVTTAGNMTLSGLPNGSYNVTIYAADLAGNAGASETIVFTVDMSEPFPTLPVLAASAVAIIVVAGLLVYWFTSRNAVTKLVQCC